MLDDFQLPKIREYEDTVISPVRTGLYDYDKAVYRHALDKTPNPNLALPFVLFDGEKRLETGHYELALSDDRKYLLLIQSQELKALVPAIKVVYKRSDDYQNRVEEIEKEKAKLEKKRKTTKKLDEELENIKQLELNAKIYDSKEGYYVIEYKKFNTYAWGYVPY